MKFGLVEFLTLLGALGFFIFGMKIMSEGIQKVAGSKMRQILGAMTSNRFAGVVTGFFITGLVQSSSVTTVMVVSFVNAGLLTLVESIGVIMGANIGTTITAWLISLIGFKVKISSLSLPIIAIGFPFLFARRNRAKAWGETLVGFALLFLGLEALKSAVPDLRSNPEVLEFLTNFTGYGILSTISFILVGTLITIVVQSSSAAMALTLVAANSGWIPFEMAAAMVLGENIGTTITANLAALIGNVHAKRAARAHLVFNIFGVTWMILLFPFFLQGIDYYMRVTHGVSPLSPDQPESIPISLSIFHTTFNILNVVMLIGFVPVIERAVQKMVPSKGDDDEFRLDYIGTNLVRTPEISILEARKELAKFGAITARMSGFIRELVQKKKNKKRVKLMTKIEKHEEITDRMEVELAKFLSRVAEGNISGDSSAKLRALLSINNDLERIADIFYQMSKSIERKNESDLWFTEKQTENLLQMLDKVDEAFKVMNENLQPSEKRVFLKQAKEKERNINAERDVLRRSLLKSIEDGTYHVQSGMIYHDLFASCEKVGDHIINVTEALAGKI